MFCRLFCCFGVHRRGGEWPKHGPERPAEDGHIAKKVEDRTRINEMIRTSQIRVIDEEGGQLGIMTPRDALRVAEEKGLDLVEVAPNSVPPVCRIMDYGKYKYQQAKRVKESRKNQHVIVIKEVKYRPKIDKHDFETKTNHVREFLEEGNKVKLTIMFRGREMAHPEFGVEIIKKVAEQVKSLGTPEYDVDRVRLEGRSMTLILTPVPQKAVKPAAAEAVGGGQE